MELEIIVSNPVMFQLISDYIGHSFSGKANDGLGTKM